MLAADISVFWEQDRLDACHLPSARKEYVIGEAAGCHHFASGLTQHSLVRVEDEAVLVVEPVTGREHRLTLGEHMTVGVGTLAFEVTAVRAGALVLSVSKSKKSDAMGPHLLLASVLHLMFAAVLVSMPRDVSSLELDGFADTRASMSFLSMPEISPAAVVEPISPSEPAARDPRPSVGAVSSATSVRTRRSENPSPPAERDAPSVAALRAHRVAASAADSLARALEAGMGPAGEGSSVLGRRGGDAWSRLEVGSGAPVGLADGWGGAPAGRPSGGGSPGGGYDVGPMATRGRHDDAPRNWGPSGRLGQRTPKTIVDTFSGRVEITDGLDLETVRRVIRQHVAEYRTCYERQLNVNHQLAGKVTVKFVIGGNGDVIAVSVDEDTSGDPALGGCIAERVRRWGFPPPAGGGRVVVRYPFVFRTSGG